MDKMTKHQQNKMNELALKLFPVNGTLVTDINADSRRGFIMGYTAAFNECSEIIEKLESYLTKIHGETASQYLHINDLYRSKYKHAFEALSELKKWRGL